MVPPYPLLSVTSPKTMLLSSTNDTILAIKSPVVAGWLVQYLKHLATECGHVENLPRSGRPTKLTKRGRRAIWRTIKRIRKLTREQIRHECTTDDVSRATIYRCLPKDGKMSQTPKWAKERENWTADEFREGTTCIGRQSDNTATGIAEYKGHMLW